MASLENITTWIDTQSSPMQACVERWCAINSHTTNLDGLSGLSRDVANTFHVLGEVESIALPAIEQINDTGQPIEQSLAPILSMRVRPDAPIQALLVIHLDTVYSPTDSFRQVEQLDANTLRGPGVADAKGGVAVMFTALQAFEQTQAAANLGYRVILNTDEEIGSPGSAPLLADAASVADLGLVYEPALPNGQLIGARVGSGHFSVTLTGHSTHAGRSFDHGRNAVVAAAELATQLHAFNDRAGLTVNVGRIIGGGAINVVPDLCVLRFNMRVETTHHQQDATQRMETLVRDFNQRDGFTACLHGSFHNPPKPMTKALSTFLNHVQQVGQSLGMTLQHEPSAGVCDGNKLAAAGLPTIDTLGPIGWDIHSPNESLDLRSLTERAKLTAALLNAYATGQLTPPKKQE